MSRIVANFMLSVVGAGAGILGSITGHITAWVGVYAAIAGSIGATFAALNGYYEWRKKRREDAAAKAQKDGTR